MKRKILVRAKIAVLLTAVLVLTSCENSCDLIYRAFLDGSRFVYIAAQNGMYGLSGAQAFLLGFTSSLFYDDVVTPASFVGVASPYPFVRSSTAHASSTQKPPMYAVSSTNNSVYVIDSNSDQLITKITVGSAPTRAKVSPDNASVYVSNSQSDTISVINMASNAVTATIPLTSGSHPTAMAFLTDGSALYVVNSAQNSVSVVDTGTQKLTATFPVGNGPVAIAITPDGTLAYVLNKDNTVWVIDTLTNTKVTTVSVTNPTSIVFSKNGSTAYITSAGTTGSLVLLRTKDYTTSKTVTVGSNPDFVTRDTYETLIYVANKSSNNITVINGSDLSIAGTIPIGGSPNAIVSIP